MSLSPYYSSNNPEQPIQLESCCSFLLFPRSILNALYFQLDKINILLFSFALHNGCILMIFLFFELIWFLIEDLQMEWLNTLFLLLRKCINCLQNFPCRLCHMYEWIHLIHAYDLEASYLNKQIVDFCLCVHLVFLKVARYRYQNLKKIH